MVTRHDYIHAMSTTTTHDVPGRSAGLLKLKDAATYLGTSQSRLRDLTRAGKIAAVRDGRDIKFTVVELDRYVAELPAYEPAATA